MGIKEALEGKKEWRALQKRANQLPNDYRIVYKEIQKYFMKVDPVNLASDFQPLVDNAQQEKSVLQVTGEDVAAFADGLLVNQATSDNEMEPKSKKL